jgi:hypothetical protein
MHGEASCPECDSPVPAAQAVCAWCGWVLIEERIVGGGGRRVVSVVRRRRPLAAAAILAAAAAGLVLFTAPEALTPASDVLRAAEAERRVAARYPHLRHAEHAVIACPERAIQPGDEARCWVLARVGWQRSVIVRLSRRGNRVQIED